MRTRLRLMPCRLLSPWRVSPAWYCWTTCRLNSIEYLRCVAMGFLLESPVQIVRFSAPHLSTRRGALQSASKVDPSYCLTEECYRSRRSACADGLRVTSRFACPGMTE